MFRCVRGGKMELRGRGGCGQGQSPMASNARLRLWALPVGKIQLDMSRFEQRRVVSDLAGKHGWVVEVRLARRQLGQ